MLVLVNPLVYMCEGFRAALTTAPHMSLWAIYAGDHRVLRPVHLARDQRVQAPRPELNPGVHGVIWVLVCAATQVTFRGVRGSTPCDGHQFERYGGNTSCVEW